MRKEPPGINTILFPSRRTITFAGADSLWWDSIDKAISKMESFFMETPLMDAPMHLCVLQPLNAWGRHWAFQSGFCLNADVKVVKFLRQWQAVPNKILARHLARCRTPHYDGRQIPRWTWATNGKKMLNAVPKKGVHTPTLPYSIRSHSRGRYDKEDIPDEPTSSFCLYFPGMRGAISRRHSLNKKRVLCLTPQNIKFFRHTQDGC